MRLEKKAVASDEWLVARNIPKDSRVLAQTLESRPTKILESSPTTLNLDYFLLTAAM